MKPTIIIAIISFILGLISYHMLFKPEVKTEIVEVIRTETDTVYQQIRDTVEVVKDRIITEYIKDTVINNVPVNLSRFKGMEPLTYGNIHYSGIVAGEVLKIWFRANFDIPEVTNTIYKDRTVTKTIESKGSLYLGGFVSSEMNITPSLAYQSKGWQIGYSYELGTEVHRIGVMKGLF